MWWATLVNLVLALFVTWVIEELQVRDLPPRYWYQETDSIEYKLDSTMRKAILKYPDKGWYCIQCPACKQDHVIAVNTSLEKNKDIRWGFNDDLIAPTFTPSIRITWGKGANTPPDVCHFYITNGKIRYCSDCTHSLAGKIVDLPKYPDDEIS